MKTVWALQKDPFDDTDAIWCRGLGVNIYAEPLRKDVYLSGRISHSINIGWKIRLTTETQRQEDMLKLKYGDRLHLVR